MRTGSLVLLGAAVGFGVMTVPLLGQRPPVAEPNTVSIYVTVEDAQHRPVRGLSRDSFEVMDDDRKLAITQFGTSVESLMVVLLLDTSASMEGVMTPLKTAAADFVAGLPPRDIRRIGLMKPGEVQFSRMDDSSSPRDLRAYLLAARADGSAAPWDGLDEALEDLKFGIGRRVIVLCSDGADSSSRTNPRQVAEKARDSGISVYVVATPRSDPGSLARPSAVLKTLTEDTGGLFFNAEAIGDLPRMFSRLAEELHSQYAVSFVPPRADGRPHRLSVKVNQAGVTVRAPTGYAATDR